MDEKSELMNNAQSAEDGATGDFFGPKIWVGFPEKLTPEAAVGKVSF